ncbi:MAG: hypothetical protein IJQ28_00915, partial [Clostridia bacterium]|nr:hypothetical protein [Clostridia bacterium]
MIKNKKYTIMFIISIVSLFVIFAYDKMLYVLNIFRPVFYAGIIAYFLDGLVRLFIKKLKIKRGIA